MLTIVNSWNYKENKNGFASFTVFVIWILRLTKKKLIISLQLGWDSKKRILFHRKLPGGETKSQASLKSVQGTIDVMENKLFYMQNLAVFRT